MNSNFDAAFAAVLSHEGGFVHHPKDPGGMTCLGVTKAVWDFHTGGDCTEAEMRALTPSAVTPVYRKNYWNAVRGDELPAGIDYMVFDCAVNSGPRRAIKLLQTVLYVDDDGVLGPRTLAAVRRCDPIELIENYSQQRLDFLRGLPTWETFGKGWGRRVGDVELEAKSIILGETFAT